MRSLQLFGDRDLRITEMDAPPPPAAGEVQIRVKALALNYLDVWGFRGMAFAKRKMPQAVGVEASGEIAAVGEGVTRFKVGDPVTMYGAETCGHCKACRKGWDNLCENVAGIMGFHIDGFARELINRPERLVVPVPKNVSFEEAARPARPSASARCSTCCSTMPNWSRVNRSSSMRAGRASAPRR
jgi:NADPH:quinone reductase-like Zn-dependent oxidoreductase